MGDESVCLMKHLCDLNSVCLKSGDCIDYCLIRIHLDKLEELYLKELENSKDFK